MENLTLPQRLQIIKSYYSNRKSVERARQALMEIFGANECPSIDTITEVVSKLETTHSLLDDDDDAPPANHQSDQPTRQIIGILSETNILRSPYIIQLTQEISETDHLQRRRFVKWGLEQETSNPDFQSKIFFSDEANFYLDGFVNKQNCRIWGSEKPRPNEEQPTSTAKVTVWCAIWAKGIIGPYFFENKEGDPVVVNTSRYQHMLTSFFMPKIEVIDIEDMFFQQDGASWHTKPATIDILREKFAGRVISRNGDVNFPPRSCDLTPVDYFLWGYLKDEVYKRRSTRPRTIEQLKTKIHEAIASITPGMCQQACNDWSGRIEIVKRARGGLLADTRLVIFDDIF